MPVVQVPEQAEALLGSALRALHEDGTGVHLVTRKALGNAVEQLVALVLPDAESREDVRQLLAVGLRRAVQERLVEVGVDQAVEPRPRVTFHAVAAIKTGEQAVGDQRLADRDGFEIEALLHRALHALVGKGVTQGLLLVEGHGKGGLGGVHEGDSCP
jgi:hypothetical protein